MELDKPEDFQQFCLIVSQILDEAGAPSELVEEVMVAEEFGVFAPVLMEAYEYTTDQEDEGVNFWEGFLGTSKSTVNQLCEIANDPEQFEINESFNISKGEVKSIATSVADVIGDALESE